MNKSDDYFAVDFVYADLVYAWIFIASSSRCENKSSGIKSYYSHKTAVTSKMIVARFFCMASSEGIVVLFKYHFGWKWKITFT